MAWKIFWSKTAEKQLNGINKKDAQKIVTALEEIVDEPFKHVEKLRGFDLHKIRVGIYRVIISLEQRKMVIFVVETGHRSTIYRKY